MWRVIHAKKESEMAGSCQESNSSLCGQSNSTELQQPNNHQPSQSSMCITTSTTFTYKIQNLALHVYTTTSHLTNAQYLYFSIDARVSLQPIINVTEGSTFNVSVELEITGTLDCDLVVTLLAIPSTATGEKKSTDWCLIN